MADSELSSTSNVSDEQDWLNEDDGDEGDEENVQIISLLDDRVFPDALSMISYCKEKYCFDFLAIRDRLHLDFHGAVKLINFSECYTDRSIVKISVLLTTPQFASACMKVHPFRMRSR